MATATTNYNLIKIELSDSPPDITVLNTNFDIIDSKLYDFKTRLCGLSFYADATGILHVTYDDGL